MRKQLTSAMCAVTVHVSVPEELSVPLPAELHYDMTDPYAVRLSLGAPEARPVNWVFARTLLAEGLCRPTGVGDVLVFPRHGCRPHSMRIVLRSAAGAALVEIAVSEVATFLSKTFILVPSGTESLHIDLDRTVVELMSRGE
ncbi:SsgA family sporulation/cell division regulator [Streptomyces sp. NBC_01727]|uniref:SsgA family sporulation/cell division regulator n=1 Tax=Streptomyces sp. NBC_01727 TaxID=2975924 RepID=UPI002E15AD19|nr:SsgA family sporulation/cell division regulator [Streptomyces sp. NBC_01727]